MLIKNKINLKGVKTPLHVVSEPAFPGLSGPVHRKLPAQLSFTDPQKNQTGVSDDPLSDIICQYIPRHFDLCHQCKQSQI